MNKPPRILHLISRLDGYGAARMLRHLVARQAGAGQGVAVVALTATGEIAAELRDAGAAVHVLGARWRFDPIAMGRLAQLRRRVPADLLHAWDAEVRRLARFTGRASVVIANIRPGAPLAAAPRRSRDAVFADLALPADAIMIALAGPLVRSKQLDEAIWCFELVRVLHPQARLVVFGDGPDCSRLERYAGLVSEPGCVRFAGYRDDLAEMLPHADAYWQLNPSRSTPHALVEAMAAGVSIVASEVPAHRAAIEPGRTGFLAPLGNRAAVARATDELLSNAALARTIGDAARHAAVEKWSLDQRLAEYEALYRSFTRRSLTGG